MPQDGWQAAESPSVIPAAIPPVQQNSNPELAVESPGVPKQKHMDADREPQCLLQLQLCALVFLGGLDGVLLYCSFLALREDLGLALGELATLGVVQSISGVVTAPAWAALADSRYASRRCVLVVGAVGQGLVTVLLGFVTWWWPMIALRALNGVMLASLGPLVNGIIADRTSVLKRGKVYGLVNLAGQVGSFFGTLAATPMSTALYFGMQGWRVTFVLSGLLAMLTGAWVALSMDLPRCERNSKEQLTDVWLALGEARRLVRFLRIPTFDVLVLQGLFGSVGMSAGGFQTMYFQMVGISDALAGAITSCGTVAAGAGILLGGYMGDFFAGRFEHHGRVLMAELSLVMGIPLKFLMFWGIAPFDGNWVWYIVLTCLHGLLACWVTAGAKLPLLSEIVPDADRSSVMAWEGTLEGLSGTLLGGPVVAILANAMFGFDEHDLRTGRGSANARALGYASAMMVCGPATISVLCWLFMHWSYPRDLKRSAHRS